MERLRYGGLYCCVRGFRSVGLQPLAVVCSAGKGVVKRTAGLMRAEPLTVGVRYGDVMLRQGVSNTMIREKSFWHTGPSLKSQI